MLRPQRVGVVVAENPGTISEYRSMLGFGAGQITAAFQHPGQGMPSP